MANMGKIGMFSTRNVYSPFMSRIQAVQLRTHRDR